MSNSFLKKMSWGNYVPSLRRSAHVFLVLLTCLMGISIYAMDGIEIQIDVVGYVSTASSSVANIYPNPASAQISIEPEETETIFTIEIFTSEMVLVTTLDATDQSSFTVSLNTGTYYFRVKTESDQITKLVQITQT